MKLESVVSSALRQRRSMPTEDDGDSTTTSDIGYSHAVHVEHNGNYDVRFRLMTLSGLLMCSLCEGFFKDATTIKECQHTYCRSCLLMKVVKNGYRCPRCNFRMSATKLDESIQSDSTIQSIVDKLFPGFVRNEENEALLLYQRCNEYLSSFQDTGPDAVDTGWIRKLIGFPSLGSATHSPSSHASSSHASDRLSQTVTASAAPLNYSLEFLKATSEWLQLAALQDGFPFIECHGIKVSLVPANDQVPKLPRPYLFTSRKLQVRHLSKFVADYLSQFESPQPEEPDVPRELRVEIMLANQVLPSSHTLEFICRSRRMRIDLDSPTIVLRYSVLNNRGLAPRRLS